MAEHQENPGIRRERSARYPAVPLSEAVAFCRQMDELGIDGLNASQIATAMGYRNVKTNTFSGRLSSARQFNLIVLNDQNYSLTPLAMRILHPIDPDEVPLLLRQSCRSPHLFGELLRQYAGKRLPEPEILANLLMHRHQITASAKTAAAESFFDSIRHAGLLDDQRVVNESAYDSADPVFTGSGSDFSHVGTSNQTRPISKSSESSQIGQSAVGRNAVARSVTQSSSRTDEVRFDLALWDQDAGKRIRLRAPEKMTRASMDRFLEALRLSVRVVDDQTTDSSTNAAEES